MSSPADQPRPSLRERKKAKTRSAIQRSALRLFLEQGYEAITVEQIAEAAEVSPSTFFRYFPTKEDVAMYDDLDSPLITSFNAQPENLSPTQALSAALHEVFEGLPSGLMEQQWERARLILTIPELRMRMLDQFTDLIQVIAGLVAKRVGRRADEFAVQVYAGAVIGALLAAFFDGIDKPIGGVLAQMDAALAYLESGLPL